MTGIRLTIIPSVVVIALAVVAESGGAGGWTVYLRRAGPIMVGMSLRQVRLALGDQAASMEGNAPEAALDECAYLSSRALPKGIGLMLERGRVVRIDVRQPGIYTASGIGVGSTEADVKRTYSDRISVKPHKYIDGHYLWFNPTDKEDRALAMVFETDGIHVTSFRTGTAAAVSLVEGCA